METRNDKELLRAKQAAEYLGISAAYIYKLVERRKIPHYRSVGGKVVYFKVADLASYAMNKFYPAEVE